MLGLDDFETEVKRRVAKTHKLTDKVWFVAQVEVGQCWQNYSTPEGESAAIQDAVDCVLTDINRSTSHYPHI